MEKDKDKITYIFVSKRADALPEAKTMLDLGHNVLYWCYDPKSKAKWQGMGITYVDNLFEEIVKYDKDKLVLIFDFSELGDMATFLIKDGYHCVGAALEADKLEEVRTYAKELVAKFMKTPPTREFNSFEEAKSFIRKQKDDDKFVFKPEGEEMPSSWTYVGKDKADMLNRLEYFSKNWTFNCPIKFEMQDFIPGIEADFSGYFNGIGFLEDCFEWYFEDKKAFNGNLGPAVGCADAIQFFATSREPYFKKYMINLIPFLKKSGYRGQISMNNIFSEKDQEPYFLEFCVRNGYDAFQNEMYAISSSSHDPTDLINALAFSKSVPKGYFPHDKYYFNVRCMLADAYFGTPKDYKGHIVGFDDSIKNNLYLEDVYFNELDDKMECAGTSGIICTANTSSDTIDGAISDLYDNILPKLNVADISYRTDGAKRVKKDLTTLMQWGQILPRLKI